MELTLANISKRFGAVHAVRDLSLTVARGEWLSLLGPSGCGKTTTLRMIAGFMMPDSGSIAIKGRDVTAAPPYRRNTGMVFQNYALFPHLTVEQNVGYGLRFRKVPTAEVNRRVGAVLALVRLSGFEKRYPTRELSGGQQQRVALARALVIEPDVLLLDEPLSNLDAKLRDELCIEMAELQRRLELTTVYVTHDQGEALSMSSRVAVMSGGRIEQLGAPTEIYERPGSLFVADFLGSVNKLPSRVASVTQGETMIALTGATQPVTLKSSSDATVAAGQDVVVAVRPERIRIRRESHGGAANEISGTVRHVAFFGTGRRYKVDIGCPVQVTLTATHDTDITAEAGDKVVLAFEAADCWVYEPDAPQQHPVS